MLKNGVLNRRNIHGELYHSINQKSRLLWLLSIAVTLAVAPDAKTDRDRETRRLSVTISCPTGALWTALRGADDASVTRVKFLTTRW